MDLGIRETPLNDLAPPETCPYPLKAVLDLQLETNFSFLTSSPLEGQRFLQRSSR